MFICAFSYLTYTVPRWDEIISGIPGHVDLVAQYANYQSTSE